MAKKIVRLTENQLHNIISESVNQILNEKFNSEILTNFHRQYPSKNWHTNYNGPVKGEYSSITDDDIEGVYNKADFRDTNGNFNQKAWNDKLNGKGVIYPSSGDYNQAVVFKKGAMDNIENRVYDENGNVRLDNPNLNYRQGRGEYGRNGEYTRDEYVSRNTSYAPALQNLKNRAGLNPQYNNLELDGYRKRRNNEVASNVFNRAKTKYQQGRLRNLK